MTRQHDIKLFDDLCQTYSTWIIKYSSATFDTPFFLVWYTDTDEKNTDRLLTFKTGDIFATKSLINLKDTILSIIDKLAVFDNLKSWLDNFNDLEPVKSCTYDITSITGSIEKGNLNIPTIESLVDFINLYGDFVNQDVRNNNLQGYVDIEPIKETWDYFYEFIFWPRLNDKTKYGNWDRPQLLIDTKELLLKLEEVIGSFENKIKQRCKPAGTFPIFRHQNTF